MKNDMSFLEHLEALRWVVLNSLIAFCIMLVPGWLVSEKLIDFLVSHVAPKAIEFKLHYFTLLEPFILQIKVAMAVAMILAFPFISVLFYRFIAPALSRSECRRTFLLALVGFFLALAGALFAVFLIFPLVIKFSLSFASGAMYPMIGVTSFVTLVASLALACAVLFQVPIILAMMMLLGFVSEPTIRRLRPFVLVAILFLAALFTPPDVISQLALALPTYALFELSLLVGRVFSAKKSVQK